MRRRQGDRRQWLVARDGSARRSPKKSPSGHRARLHDHAVVAETRAIKLGARLAGRCASDLRSTPTGRPQDRCMARRATSTIATTPQAAEQPRPRRRLLDGSRPGRPRPLRDNVGRTYRHAFHHAHGDDRSQRDQHLGNTLAVPRSALDLVEVTSRMLLQAVAARPRASSSGGQASALLAPPTN